jgi:MYXO-CTERM domain-containing protein
MIRSSALVLISACAALSARADFLSFASDSNFAKPTFSNKQSGAFIFDGGNGPNDLAHVNLLYDADEDGPNPAISIPSYFTFVASTREYSALPFGAGVIHAYRLAGSFVFTPIANTSAPLLTVSFNDALFTSYSGQRDLLGSAGAIEVDSFVDPTLSFVGGGLFANKEFTGIRNFSFSISALRNLETGGRQAINTGSGAFLSTWASEGSFSAQFTPTPGAMSVLGLAGLAGLRRRR